MTSTREYPELDQLFGAYFNQDFELWGETIEQIVAAYMDGATTDRREALLKEIDSFTQDHPGDLDSAFSARYGFDFDPAPWGHTTLSFLQRLQQLLREK